MAELLPNDRVADHDCLLRASDMLERTAETVRIFAYGNEAHRVIWEQIQDDSLRLRRMARELGQTIPRDQWIDDARSVRR